MLVSTFKTWNFSALILQVLVCNTAAVSDPKIGWMISRSKWGKDFSKYFGIQKMSPKLYVSRKQKTFCLILLQHRSENSNTLFTFV